MLGSLLSRRETPILLLCARTVVAVTLSLAWACGGDDTSDSGSDGSGIERNTLLIELTDTQAQALCRYGERVYKNSLGAEEAYCVAAGASGASSSQECELWQRDCLESGNYHDDRDEGWECESATREDFADVASAYGGNCNSTVGHYEDCISFRARNRRQFMESASCDDPSSFPGMEEPPHCTALGPCETGAL
jgi:hypothetical protein